MGSDLFEGLAAPFPPDAISWRVGSTNQEKTKGLALAYLDARDVMDRLDQVCGPAGWQCRYSHVGGVTVCEIGIRSAPDEWLWKADGAGATDVEAEKGALSDAFKRAAVRWGIGRYLYSLASPWVELTPAGRSYKIKDSEYGKLRALLGGVAPKPKAQSRGEYDSLVKEIAAVRTSAELISWGNDEKGRIDALPSDWKTSLREEFTAKLADLKVEEQSIRESEELGIRA